MDFRTRDQMFPRIIEMNNIIDNQRSINPDKEIVLYMTEDLHKELNDWLVDMKSRMHLQQGWYRGCHVLVKALPMTYPLLIKLKDKKEH